MKIEKFEDIPVWKLALKITKLIYDTSSTEKFSKDYGLKDQIRRAVVSISSNIVEGFEKNNNNELVRYLKIAKGSCGETRNQVYIALVVGYINQKDFDEINNLLLETGKQIGGFVKYLEELKKNLTTKKSAIRNSK
ncbi:MAG: four helix bundle protein [candidate division SR1 bacterium]|nr:four helix bundle protein [candidate division SR1 bacterium]